MTPVGFEDVAVVVPCFNEEERLDPEAFAAFSVPGIRCVFVDDGSTDGTIGLIEGLAALDPQRHSVVSLETNRGKGEAVRAGLRHALGAGADVVGYLDADLSTGLDEIPRFLERLAADPTLVGVLGSRVNLLGHEIERRRLRHAAGRVFASGAVLALGFSVYDTQCGAKFFRASDALMAAVDEPFGSRWSFDVELIARIAAVAGPESMVELPVLSWRDVPGSKVRFWHSISALLDLVRIRRRYR